MLDSAIILPDKQSRARKPTWGFSSTIKHSWSHPNLPISSRVHLVRFGFGFRVVGGWVVLIVTDFEPVHTPQVILQTFAISVIEQSTSGA